MAGAPLKISAKVEIDASQAAAGAAVASTAVDKIGASAKVSATALQQLIAASTGLHDGAANSNVRAWTGALAAEGLAVDQLRAKYNPLFATIQRYQQAKIEIRTANAMGALSVDEMAAALSRERQAALASMDAIKGRSAQVAAMEQLRAQLVPLHAAQMAYEQTLRMVDDAQAKGVISASEAGEAIMRAAASFERAKASLESYGRQADQTATAMQRLINSRTGAPSDDKMWTGALADQARAVDELRAKYNPLFATIQRYQQAKAEIRTANALGALSVDEMSAALSRERQAALASIDAIKGRNKALADTPAMRGGSGSSAFDTANLAYQFQDVTVTAAMGMNPLMIGLQQGMQMASVIGQMEQPIAGLAGAFASLVSPVSLVTIGLTAGAAALIQYFTSADEGTTRANAALEGHAALISRLKGVYGEAAAGLQNYAAESEKIVRQDTIDQVKAFQTIIMDVARQLESDVLSRPASAFGGATFTIQQMQGALAQLSSGLQAGNPDLKLFVERMIEIENQQGTPETIRALIRELRETAKAGLEAQSKLQPLTGFIDHVGAAAARQAEQISRFASALQSLAGIAVPALTNIDQARIAYQGALANAVTPGDRADARAAYDDARRRIDNQNPVVINSDGNATSVPLPGTKPITLGDSVTKSAGSAANAYRDLVKSAQDRVDQMKLEAQLAGETGVAAETLRFRLGLLQDAEDKGRTISDKQRAAIEKQVEAFKQYAEAAAGAKLKADLLWESDQLGRSTMDRQIASRLKSAGLEVDFSSVEAGLIRTNLQLEQGRQLAGEFFGTFFDGIEQGKGLWDSLGDAAINALKKISDTLLNDVLNSLFKVNSAASGSGGGLFGGGGGFLSSIFGSLFSPQYRIAAGGGIGLFDRGGYTGPGGIHEPRGIVHAGEVVWSQADVARHGGPDVVDAMRLGVRGYDAGGVVGVAPLAARSSMRSAGAAATRGVDRIKVDVGVSVDDEGKLGAYVRNVVYEETPGMISAGLDRYESDRLPDAIASYNDRPRWR